MAVDSVVSSETAASVNEERLEQAQRWQRQAWGQVGRGHPLGKRGLRLRGMSQGYREGRQGPTLSVRDRGGASDQRPLLFTRP